MLTAHGLGVGVADRRLLTGIDLQLGDGEIMAVIGPSGCGKSTLLRVLVGLIDPLEGAVKFEGRGPDEIGWPQFRRYVMLVAQRAVLFEGTVAENLRKPFGYDTAGGISLHEDEAAEMLAAVGLERVMQQEARTLSEGQAQRMALVRAMLLGPRVLVLDEPTSALDVGSRDRVESLVRERGASVLIVSHDPAQVERFADDVLDLSPFVVPR